VDGSSVGLASVGLARTVGAELVLAKEKGIKKRYVNKDTMVGGRAGYYLSYSMSMLTRQG